MSAPSLGTVWRASLRRELTLIWRSPADIVQPLFFFVVVVSLFPLALSPKPALLALVAPGAGWICCSPRRWSAWCRWPPSCSPTGC
jgi:heme exporter protein B